MWPCYIKALFANTGWPVEHSPTLRSFITDVTSVCPTIIFIIRYSDHGLLVHCCIPSASQHTALHIVGAHLIFVTWVSPSDWGHGSCGEGAVYTWPRNVVLSSDASPFVSLTRNVENPQPQPRPR